MSKSILVIDTPECCEKCNLCASGNYGVKRCAAKDQAIFLDNKSKKPFWCPLRELPEKKIHDLAKPVEKQWGYEFTNGYNYCIDQILKEVFENPIPYNGDNIGGMD